MTSLTEGGARRGKSSLIGVAILVRATSLCWTAGGLCCTHAV